MTTTNDWKIPTDNQVRVALAGGLSVWIRPSDVVSCCPRSNPYYVSVFTVEGGVNHCYMMSRKESEKLGVKCEEG